MFVALFALSVTSLPVLPGERNATVNLASATATQYSVHGDIDCWGDDLSNQPTSDAAACQQLCQQNNCPAFTFDPPTCFLKKACSNKVAKVGCTSGERAWYDGIDSVHVFAPGQDVGTFAWNLYDPSISINTARNQFGTERRR